MEFCLSAYWSLRWIADCVDRLGYLTNVLGLSQKEASTALKE